MSQFYLSPKLLRFSRPKFARNMGLVRGLLLFCLPVPLLVIAAVFLFTHHDVERSLDRANARNSSILAQSVGLTISQALVATRNQLTMLASGASSVAEIRQRLVSRLEFLRENGDRRFCEAAFLGLGAQGNSRFLLIRHKNHLTSLDPNQAESQTGSPFHLPLRQPGSSEVVLSQPLEVSYSFADADTGQQTQVTLQLLRFTTPVRLTNGTFAGYLMMSLDLAWLRDMVAGWTRFLGSAEKTPLAFFVDQGGWMIFESDTRVDTSSGAETSAGIDTVRSGFTGDFGRNGYSQAFRPGPDYYSYWTMMSQLQRREHGQFNTAKMPWNREGLAVETVCFAPVSYNSGGSGNTDVVGGGDMVGGIVVLDTSFEASAQRLHLRKTYAAAFAAAFALLGLFLLLSSLFLRRRLKILKNDIVASANAPFATALPERAEPAEVAAVRAAANELVDQLRTLEKERDSEDNLLSARIELEEATEMPAEIQRSEGGIIGVSKEVVVLRHNILQAARVQADVLITGETGTGKELVSRAIHLLSPHKDGPFITINCGALDESLLMDSLFGHVKGAFTEARESRKGAFLAAQGGTLMLDEIGTASLKVQQALLRALSDRRISPLGSDQPVPFDTRVVAATNADLREEIRKGTFREDLYFRLAVITIRTPPLREHKEDIPYLVTACLQEAHARADSSAPIPRLSKGALSKLMHYHWPGNVRELRNTIFRAALFCSNGIILPANLHLGTDVQPAEANSGLPFLPDEVGPPAAPPAAPLPANQPQGTAEPQDSPRRHEAEETPAVAAKPQEVRTPAADTPRSPAPAATAQEATDHEASTLRLHALMQALGGTTSLFSRKEYQDAAGVSMRTAQYDLQDLVGRGLVERVGKGRTQRYAVTEKAWQAFSQWERKKQV